MKVTFLMSYNCEHEHWNKKKQAIKIVIRCVIS